MRLWEKPYLDKLVNLGFVNVDKCNFLSEELHIHRGQGLARRISPPLIKLLWE